MAEITAKMVKEVRDATGAGPKDIKDALIANDGDMQKTLEYLREKGIAKANKKLGKGRTMNQGLVEIYQHHNKQLAVIVEVNCETDFVAATEQFQAFARDIAMHIATMGPRFVKREDVPAEVVEQEKTMQLRILKEDEKNASKPDNILEKIIEGRMGKFYEEICLMEQSFFKDDNKSIQQLLTETVAEIGESVQISRFSRFVLGEDLDNSSEEGEE